MDGTDRLKSLALLCWQWEHSVLQPVDGDLVNTIIVYAWGEEHAGSQDPKTQHS